MGAGGLKHIASGGMVANKALLGGGLPSGGLDVRVPHPGQGRDLASALIVEMLARTHREESQLRARVYEINGRLYSLEDSILEPSRLRVAVPRGGWP